MLSSLVTVLVVVLPTVVLPVWSVRPKACHTATAVGDTIMKVIISPTIVSPSGGVWWWIDRSIRKSVFVGGTILSSQVRGGCILRLSKGTQNQKTINSE